MFNTVYTSSRLSDNVTRLLRSVEHQSVPLALDVIVLRLLSDIDTIKLQLSGQLLLSLEDNQRDLKGTEGTQNNVHESYKRTHQNVGGSYLCKAQQTQPTLRQL